MAQGKKHSPTHEKKTSRETFEMPHHSLNIATSKKNITTAKTMKLCTLYKIFRMDLLKIERNYGVSFEIVF